jgi:hypothetical protein
LWENGQPLIEVRQILDYLHDNAQAKSRFSIHRLRARLQLCCHEVKR